MNKFKAVQVITNDDGEKKIVDPETPGIPHISPDGMFHQKQRNSNGGIWFADVKMRHWIIKLHQDAYPELTEQMKNNPNATNIYAAFLAILPLEVQGKMTDELRRKILKTYGVC